MSHPQYLGGEYRSTKPLPNWQMNIGVVLLFIFGVPMFIVWTVTMGMINAGYKMAKRKTF